MYKITIRDRLLLLGTVLLAAYQIITGLEGLSPLPIWILTTGFGVLLVACLLLIILGFEGLESQAVVITATVIPLSISLGLVSIHLPTYFIPYLIFCLAGFGATGAARFTLSGKAPTLILAIVHGTAGLIITVLPLILQLQGQVQAGYLLVSLGGALIGLGGLLLAFLKAGRPILDRDTIYKLLPMILFLMILAFIGGFSFL